MELKNYINLKQIILQESTIDNLLTEDNVVKYVIENFLLDSKRVDNSEIEIGYYQGRINNKDCKINGYIKNETEERLQLFIFDEDTINFKAEEDINTIQRTTREKHDVNFIKSINFIQNAIGGYFHNNGNASIENIPDEKIKYLLHDIRQNDSKHKLDVIEIFLISLTVSVQNRNNNFTTKSFDFSALEKPMSISYNFRKEDANKEERITKKIDIECNLIDLNYLNSIKESINGREPVEIELDESNHLETIEVAHEQGFNTYLTVFPAKVLVDFYKKYSYRLLERNVRSFLDFKSVNQGMRNTMRNEPYKFVAFNNGLTITCNEIKTEKIDGKLYITSMKDFQIVNGGQTTASIYFSNRDGIDVSNVNVMAKINVLNSEAPDFEDMITDISKFSNTQNKVTVVDIRSNNPILVQIKKLSDTIATPQGKHWIYERSRGEIQTLRRLSGLSVAAFNNKYPSTLRLKSADIAKYYTAWGDEPHNVKKGGEKVFTNFISKLEKDNITIDRNFYENLIAKVVLFTNLENIHGSRANAIGQLRAAVVPYAISCIYLYCKSISNKRNQYTLNFDFYWKNGKLDEISSQLFKSLMTELYNWINKYKTSDDISENTKKESLWTSIKKSIELKDFLDDNKELLDQIIVEDLSLNNVFYDFSNLKDNVKYHIKGNNFYKILLDDNRYLLSDEQINQIDNLKERKIKTLNAIEGNIREFALRLNNDIFIDTQKNNATTKKALISEAQKKVDLDIQTVLMESYYQTFEVISKSKENFNFLHEDENYKFLEKALNLVTEAYYNDFSELENINQQNVINGKKNIRGHIEYLKALKLHNMIPKTIDLYQLKPLFE